MFIFEGSTSATKGTTVGKMGVGTPVKPMSTTGSGSVSPQSPQVGRLTLRNFCFMAVLFGLNHGTAVSCMALATARLGSIGALQAGMTYLCYTLSALLGATYIVKKLGSRNAMILGMMHYCVYISCFFIATSSPQDERAASLTGAIFGGVGAGILWVAQGSYFYDSAKQHAVVMSQEVSISTSYLAGIFGFILLSFETILRALSSVLIFFLSWKDIFGIYTAISITTTIGMFFLVVNYPSESDSSNAESVFHKVTTGVRLMMKDPKMKHMIGLNAVFGFGGAFLNSYVNGQVVATALDDNDSHYVGVLTSWTALVASLVSLVTATTKRKGVLLIGGVICFFFIALSFIIQPDSTLWNIHGLVAIYTLQGIGRATFESTLKATFADYFASDSVGAFSNLIMQNGITSAIGYLLTARLFCDTPSKYCVLYLDGTMHNMLSFAIIICISSVFAILGYLRASVLYKREQADSNAQIGTNDVSVTTTTNNEVSIVGLIA